MELTGFSNSDEIRTAWIAGVIEGEGWFGIVGDSRPKIQVTSTDQDVILRLREWSGIGNVTGPYQRLERKPTWRWVVSAREDAGPFMEKILPFLLQRRAETARRIIGLWKQAAPKRGTEPTCKHGHPFSGDNLVVKEGRRRCRACIARRQREYRERSRLNGQEEAREHESR